MKVLLVAVISLLIAVPCLGRHHGEHGHSHGHHGYDGGAAVGSAEEMDDVEGDMEGHRHPHRYYPYYSQPSSQHSQHSPQHSSQHSSHRRQPTRGGSSHTELDRLYVSLFDHYHKQVRPCLYSDCADATNVKFTMTPISSYLKFDHYKLYTNYWLKMMWDDPRLAWDPRDFGGIDEVRVPQEDIWIPDIELFNNAYGMDSYPYSSDHLAVVRSTGTVLIVPTGAAKSICRFNHTATEQECHLMFGSWTYPESQVNVEIMSEFSAEPPECDLKYYSGVGNEHWKLSKCEVHRESKTYDCCPDEKYVSIHFKYHFSGKQPEDE